MILIKIFFTFLKQNIFNKPLPFWRFFLRSSWSSGKNTEQRWRLTTLPSAKGRISKSLSCVRISSFDWSSSMLLYTHAHHFAIIVMSAFSRPKSMSKFRHLTFPISDLSHISLQFRMSLIWKFQKDHTCNKWSWTIKHFVRNSTFCLYDAFGNLNKMLGTQCLYSEAFQQCHTC